MRPDDHAREDARHEVGTQSVRAVVLVVALAAGVQAGDVGHWLESTHRPPIE